MDNVYGRIQELLQQRADYLARLKLISSCLTSPTLTPASSVQRRSMR